MAHLIYVSDSPWSRLCATTIYMDTILMLMFSFIVLILDLYLLSELHFKRDVASKAKIFSEGLSYILITTVFK